MKMQLTLNAVWKRDWTGGEGVWFVMRLNMTVMEALRRTRRKRASLEI